MNKVSKNNLTKFSRPHPLNNVKVNTLDKFLKKCSSVSGMEGLKKGNCYFPLKEGRSVPNVLARILFDDLVLRQIFVGLRVSDEVPEAINSEIV